MTTQGLAHPRVTNLGRLGAARLFLRFALAAAFLSAVADRFGLWGAPGGINVAWGEFPAFVEYTAQVNSFLPAGLAPVLAWASTALELFLGLALIVGFRLRIAATASGALLLLFALAMTISFGVKAPLDYSVFTASAGAFLLAALPARPSAPMAPPAQPSRRSTVSKLQKD